MIGCKTLWQYWEASSFAGCTTPATPGGAAWYHRLTPGVKGLATHCTGAIARFPIPYLQGSVITQAQVKWSGEPESDTLIFRAVKRAETAPESPETVIDEKEEQCAAEFDDITLDLDNTEIANGFTYWLEIESNIATDTAEFIFYIAIETSKRIL